MINKIKHLITNIIILSFLYSSEFILPKFEKSPIIDGIIDEEWKNAIVFKDFKEWAPNEGAIPEAQTEVYIGYDQNNLYVAFKCFDDVNTIKKTLTRRDEFAMDDMVFVYLDAYGKEREGFIFGTNPVSTQFDGFKFPPPGNEEDWSFDTDWEVKSYIDDTFWSAEFRIPFSSLRFEVKEIQKWNIVFLRIRPRESMFVYSFPPLSSDNPSMFSQALKIIIPEKIYTRIKRTDVIPYLITFQNSGRDTSGKYVHERLDYDLGITSKYRFLENLVLDFALNPDFAQVETDFPQIDFNTIYALYYPEKRPFFMEGSHLISSPIEIFYSRAINNPFYSLKLLGRYKFFDLYLLSAYDENTLFIIPFEDRSISFPTDKKSFSNFLRFRSDFLNKESFIGFIFSNRVLRKDSFDNGYNTLFSFDLYLRFLKNYTLKYQGVYSLTKEPSDSFLYKGYGFSFKNYNDKFDGEKFNGFANHFEFNFSSKNLIFGTSYQELSPTFRSDLGFISRNNYRRINLSFAPQFYPIKYKINEIFPKIYYRREYNYDGILKKEEIGIKPNIKFPFRSLNLGFDLCRKYRFYMGKEFKNMDMTSFWFEAFPFKWLNLNFSTSFGEEIFYQEMKIIYTLNYFTNIHFLLGKMQSGFSYGQGFYYLKRFKEEFFRESVLSCSMNYSFTEYLSLRIILTGNINKGFPSIYGFYPLISYELTPFTVFYLGANINTIKHPLKIEGENHQIFLKFQYMFQF